MIQIRKLEKSDEVAFRKFQAILLAEKAAGNDLVETRKIDDFAAFLAKSEREEYQTDDPEWSTSTKYYAFDGDELVARIGCRWELKGDLARVGGHIGYVTRTDYRGRGIMTELLRFALAEYRKRGIDKVLITARVDNPASRRVIEKQGGQLDGFVEDRGYQWARYWVRTGSPLLTDLSFIWDFDGTLVDSYPAIIEALAVTYRKFNLSFDREWISNFIIKESVGQLLRDVSDVNGIDFDELYAVYTHEQGMRNDQIILMPYVKTVLEWTERKRIQNFIYTHKNKTTQSVLDRLGIASYFTEVLTSDNGFKRKPHPEGVEYLVAKYGLDKAKTYYIGDRQLDVDVALNAGIQSINLNQPKSDQNTYITSLADLPRIFGF